MVVDILPGANTQAVVVEADTLVVVLVDREEEHTLQADTQVEVEEQPGLDWLGCHIARKTDIRQVHWHCISSKSFKRLHSQNSG